MMMNPGLLFRRFARLATVAAMAMVVGCSNETTGPTPSEITSPVDAGKSLPEMAESSGAVEVTSIDYESRGLSEYESKWVMPYGRLSLDANGTLDVSARGAVTVGAVPFQIGADYSVFDHLKYIAISAQEFEVPENGSLTFSVEIQASTPGTTKKRVIHGCYGPPGSFVDVNAPCDQPWEQVALQGMQAGVVLNMINFATGQLFDWFVSENQVFALIERLPSNVTNPAAQPGDPGYVGLDKAYTQIIASQNVAAGKSHKLAIRYRRGPRQNSTVEYFLNDKLFASVDNVGVPLDVQGVPFTGLSPSYGPGELLKDQLNSFVIGHGLFSLLDAFPYQHPERPDLSVSIPMSERLFGQGAVGTFRNFKVVQVSMD
jgi:hypothetical protein